MDADFNKRFCFKKLILVDLLIVSIVISSAKTDDLYGVLGVDKTATAQEIKQAYKNLAKEWHPDKNQDPTANEKFMKINEAYETLSSSEKRNMYDTYGTTSSHPGNEQQWSPSSVFTSSNHGTFNFGGFTFTFTDSGFDSSTDRYVLSLQTYKNTVIPESRRKPYLIFVYSDYCLECVQVEDVWEQMVQELHKSDIGIGTINTQIEATLSKVLRVSNVPAVVGVIDGKLRWFSQPFTLQNLRDFTRSLFPTDLIQEVNNQTLESFLEGWKLNNKIQMLFFDIRSLPPIRYVAAAFAWRQQIAAGYVNVARIQYDWTMTNFNILRNQENLLLFNEYVQKPAAQITMPTVGRIDIDKAIKSNQFLILPRISSPAIFNEFCLPQSPAKQKKLCVILLTRNTGQHDIYRESFREYASRHTDDRVKYAYVYEETQMPLVKLMTFGKGIINDTLDTTKVAILWRKDQKTIHYDWLEYGWYASGSELQRSRIKLKHIVDWLLQTSDVMQYTMQIRSEILDEQAPSIWIRVFYRILTWIERAWEKFLSVDEILLLTVVTTAILVVVVGVVVRMIIISEDAKVHENIPPKSEKTVVDKNVIRNNSQEYENNTRPTVYIHPLCHENYEELVLKNEPGVRLMVILVDENSRTKLLQYFAWILLPYLKSQAFKLAFLQLEEYLSWYKRLLELTGGLLENQSNDIKRNLTDINMRNCLGTVLAINGRKKFYYMYHYSQTRSESVDGNPSEDESDKEMSAEAKKLFESDLLCGFGRWMERLCAGSLKRYRVSVWPNKQTLKT